MREIGGYIELDKYNLPMLHEDAIALNCGRNCLAYLIRAKQIKKIVLPYFLCDSVRNVCLDHHVNIRYYHINEKFIPQNVTLDEEEWLYVVNFYGQLDRQQIEELKIKHINIIVDNAQAYFEMPVDDVDTLYTCRKFFGVADGAFLYTNVELKEELPIDISYNRMQFLLGRYECTASEFYGAYVENNNMFSNADLKKMSRLTNNLLHAIDYEKAKERRTQNYDYLFKCFEEVNKLKLKEVEGAFSYPLWLENAGQIRARLQAEKIYIPTLWPNVIKDSQKESLEKELATNILPIPCDQRYNLEDMQYVIEMIKKYWKV